MIVIEKQMIKGNQQGGAQQTTVLGLVSQLCRILEDHEISYCHWKSNAALNRSASGQNDLDLLVDRNHAQQFMEVLYRLGFREALAPKQDELPGVKDFYGLDTGTGKLLHVHAHFQLILGNDLSKNYRLPVEKVYLETSRQGDLFRVPLPEWELVIFVIRMVLKHSTWDAILMRHGRLSSSEQQELSYLLTPDVRSKVRSILKYIPGLYTGLFDDCIQTLQAGCSLWKRICVAEQLQKALQSTARRSHFSDLTVKFVQRLWQPLQRIVFRNKPKNRFASGGLFIAIVGGDGAGKTTVIDDLFSWFSEKFDVTRIHMGKPDWSWMTFIVRGILKIGTLLRLYRFEGDVYDELHQPHGYPWFIRSVCTARDRYLTYRRARRLSSNGGLVLCDRFSFPDFMAMDGPQCEPALSSLETTSWVHRFLAKLEISYYEQIRLPDLLFVLKVKPEVAIQRKRDESETSVQARSAEVWERDWTEKMAFVIDASLPRDEVVSQVRSLVWAHL